jgi:RecA/RadA recombinase
MQDFRSYLNNVAYLYLTDPDFQKISDLASINWSSLPEFDCVKIVRKYQVLRATQPHRSALSEISHDINFLERFNLDLKTVGHDEDAVAHNFKKKYKTHQYQLLAKRILENPDMAEKILSDFNINLPPAVAVKTVSEFLPDTYQNFLDRQKLGKEKNIIPGFEMLSHMIGGFNFGRLIMVLGETGFGKTNFALNLLVRAATKEKCLFINMEMPLEDITNRLVVLTSGKTFKDLYLGLIPHNDVTNDLRAYGHNLKFTNGFSLGLQSIEALIRKEKANGLSYVVIDYDQKIDLSYSKNIPEWKMLQIAVQRIEDLSKELEVCVILLAQVNREGSVSSSHRATFTAHTILNFKSNDAQTAFDKKANAMISAEKNRHGKKDQALLVGYNDSNLGISEIEVITYQKQDGKRNAKI